MISLRFFCQQLEPYVVRGLPEGQQDTCSHRVELLEEQTVLYRDRLYLGTVQSAAALAQIQAEPGTVVMLAQADAGTAITAPDGCRVLLFSCSMARIHNSIQQDILKIEEWQTRFQKIIERGGDFHDVLSVAAWEAGGGAVLLDAHGRLVASAGLEEGSYLAKELLPAGAMNRRSLGTIFTAGTAADGYRQMDLPDGEGTLHASRISHDDETAFILLLESRKPLQQLDLCGLCNCTANYLRHKLFAKSLVHWDPFPKEFQRCWEDIMGRRLINRGEIRAALSKLPFPVYKYNRILLISFENANAGASYSLVMSRLRDFFPQANMTVYQNDIIVLLSYEKRTFIPTELEQDKSLCNFLEHYHAIMMVGNGTKNDEGLGSIYLLCKRTIELACLLREDKKQRIFFCENYLVYSIIDLCTQRYLESEINSDILYLCHPAVTLLTRYDREHNTDLRDVLFYYLLHDCNVISTAATMYMHRNTINNKVNQIKKLIKLELDDPRLRQRLLLSCQIMRYYEIVLQREMQ